MLVVGDKEIKDKAVNVRNMVNRTLKRFPSNSFAEMVKSESETRITSLSFSR